MMQRAVTLMACAALGAATDLYAACGDELPAATRRLAVAGEQQVYFAARGGPLTVGRHFALDIVVCPGPGAEPISALRVDADMPAHRHGMNYRPEVKALGAGRFEAQGLMLHMPGRWRFIFDLGSGSTAQRVTHEVQLP